jgi:hypothetical protein
MKPPADVTHGGPADRLDRAVAAAASVSRTAARALIAAGAVFLNGQRCKVASRTVRTGDRLRIGAEPSGDRGALPVLFDAHGVLAIDKPAGMPSAPTRQASAGTALTVLTAQRGGGRLWVVHRLDAGTSGVLLFATTPGAAAGLSSAFRDQRVQRYGKDGRFRNGWFVKAHGGHFGIGLTSDGRAVVCTGRGRQILVFELDGQSVGDPRPCFRAPHEVPKILQPTDFPHGDLNLQRAIPVDPPSPSLVSILLVPLWHPFVAWFMALVGYVALRFGRADRQTGSSPSAAGSA